MLGLQCVSNCMAAAPRRKTLQKKGTFTCEKCNLSTPYYSFGRNHPFDRSFVLLEDAYLTRDPFSPAPHPLILGSHCFSCRKVVCVSPTCSVFYTKRFCTDCVLANQDEFPPQIQEEVRRETAAVREDS